MPFYDGDSLFTLTGLQIAGVLAVGLGLAGLTLALLWHLSRNRAWPMRLALALVAAALFDWLSPQGFYEYYRVIIPGLPRQIVVGEPTGLIELARLYLFQGPETLSAHGRGLFYWTLLIVALWRFDSRRRNAAN